MRAERGCRVTSLPFGLLILTSNGQPTSNFRCGSQELLQGRLELGLVASRTGKGELIVHDDVSIIFQSSKPFQSHNHAFHPLCFKICALLGKGMKQRPTTVLLGIISMISFCLGHASLEVHQFWKEAIISWIAIVLPTGTNATYSPCLRFTLRVRRWGGPSNALGALLPHFLGKTPCTILHG